MRVTPTSIRHCHSSIAAVGATTRVAQGSPPQRAMPESAACAHALAPFSGGAKWCILLSSCRHIRHAEVLRYQCNTERGKCMKTYLVTVLASGAVVAFTGMAVAHHSFAMFDQEHPQEVTGVVKEFKYTSPHSFIILEIKDKDGSSEAWNLEGGS